MKIVLQISSVLCVYRLRLFSEIVVVAPDFLKDQWPVAICLGQLSCLLLVGQRLNIQLLEFPWKDVEDQRSFNDNIIDKST